MKNLKKVIALVAVLAMVLSTVALGATYTDVAEDSAYSTAVESLSKLGIVTGYEDGTYGPEKTVTRAEMAALIARIQGYGETAKTQTNTAFADVPSSHWASGYVAYAANQNIVNGYGDGTFGPEDTVKYEQAVTMIMRTLGFEYFATTNGGYPTGYLAAAQRYGLTNGVSNAVVGTDANRGTIAQLLYNGIDTPIMAPYKWNTNGEVEYAVYDGTDAVYKTLMSENLGVIKIKGLVTENVTTDIDDASKTIELGKDAEVSVMLIDTFDSNHPDFDEYAEYSITEMETAAVEVPFLVGESDIDTFLGERVVLYAIEDKNTDKFVVVSAALDSTTNKTAEFTLEQFNKVTTAGGKTKIEYFKNSTDRDATDLLVTGADVVYNNVGGYSVADIFGDGKPVETDSLYGGKVTLIDNDSKNGYDVIFVEVGATAVVDEVNGNKVVFKESAELATGDSINGIKVDAEAEDEIFAFVKDGEVIDVADLKEWDVLTIVANNKNAKFITAEVINSTVSGVITGTSASNTSASQFGEKFTIDGKKYDVAAGNYKAANLQIGDAGIFYIDKYGKIAAFSEDSSVAGGTAGTYGYVLFAAKETGGVSANVLQVKMITANGVDTFEAASKVKYYYADGSNATVDGDAINVNTFLNTNRYELIKYTTNANGEINAIYEAGYDAEKFVKKGAANGTYDADNFKLGRILDEDATVFFLATTPTNVAPGGNASNDNIITVDGNYYKINPSNCVMGTLADLINDESYKAEAYLDNKGEDANLLVVTVGYGKAAASSSVAVITDVANAQNDDFEDCYVLSYFANGELKEGVYTTADAAIAGLTEGDIVKINVSSAGVITKIDYAVNFGAAIRNTSTGAIVGGTVGTPGLNEAFAFGYADAYTKGTKTVTIGGTSYRLTNAENVYVIDASLKVGKVDVGSAGDFSYDTDVISAADKAKYADYVFVRTYDDRVEDVVIVKNVIDYEDSDNGIVLDTEADIAADAAADALAAYNTAKAAYETAKAAYDAAEATTVGSGDEVAVNAAIDAVQAAAADAADAADEAKALDATFDMTAYDAAEVYAAALVDVA